MLKEDIYFGKIKPSSGRRAKIRNTTTEKDYLLNPASVALLELCTGTHNIDEIVAQLSTQFGEPLEKVAESVSRGLQLLQEKDLITVRAAPLRRAASTGRNVTVDYPIESAEIEITNRCNLTCLHCVNNSGNPYSNELTTEEILSFIDMLSSMGATRITISGGEPLLHPDLFTIIEHARKAPMTVDVFTNGTLLTKNHIEDFKELGVKRVATSIDSCNERIHDTFRGQRGAFRKTFNAIHMLKEAGIPVRVSVSLVQMNKDHFLDILAFLENETLTDYQIAPVKFSGRGVSGITVSPEEFYDVLVAHYQHSKDRNPEVIPQVELRTEGGCGIAEDDIYIKADGTVLPCHGCYRVMGWDNIRAIDLEKWWNEDETLNMLRKLRPEEDEICTTCQFLPFCYGCIANAFLLKGKFRCYDPYTCAHHKAYEKVFGK